MKHLTFLFFTFRLTTAVLGQENKFTVGLEGGAGSTFLRGNSIIKQYGQP
jgi:hypothetical protein